MSYGGDAFVMAEKVLRKSDRWGDAAMRGGFTMVPNYLVAINQFATDDRRVTPTEFFVLVAVLMSWWSGTKAPFPSKTTLSSRTGLSTRQVQRALSGLEKKRYLRRVERYTAGRGRTSNSYDLKGLVSELEQAATENPNLFPRLQNNEAPQDNAQGAS